MMNVSKNMIFKMSLLILLVPGFFGCSLRNVALDYHEFVASRMAASYLDLNGEQTDLFKKHWKVFAVRLATDRIENLAQNIELLGETTKPQEQVYNLQKIAGEIMTDACVDFSPLMADLSVKQVEHLKKKIEERNEKNDPDKNGGLADFRKLKREEFGDLLERWLGRISQVQKQMLIDFDNEKDGKGEWERDYLAYSRETQGVFLSFLTGGMGKPDIILLKCSQYALSPDSYLSETSRRTKASLAASREKNLESLYGTLDLQQKKHFMQETGSLAQDLRKWAGSVRANKS
jgi:hypothetical protein